MAHPCAGGATRHLEQPVLSVPANADRGRSREPVRRVGRRSESIRPHAVEVDDRPAPTRVRTERARVLSWQTRGPGPGAEAGSECRLGVRRLCGLPFPVAEQLGEGRRNRVGAQAMATHRGAAGTARPGVPHRAGADHAAGRPHGRDHPPRTAALVLARDAASLVPEVLRDPVGDGPDRLVRARAVVRVCVGRRSRRAVRRPSIDLESRPPVTRLSAALVGSRRRR